MAKAWTPAVLPQPGEDPRPWRIRYTSADWGPAGGLERGARSRAGSGRNQAREGRPAKKNFRNKANRSCRISTRFRKSLETKATTILRTMPASPVSLSNFFTASHPCRAFRGMRPTRAGARLVPFVAPVTIATLPSRLNLFTFRSPATGGYVRTVCSVGKPPRGHLRGQIPRAPGPRGL